MTSQHIVQLILAITLGIVVAWVVLPQEVGRHHDFVDVSFATNVCAQTTEHGTFGALWADLDGDRVLDLVFMNHSAVPSIYVNQGEQFSDWFRTSGVRTDSTYPEQQDRHGGACGDYDNDGDLDLFFTHGAMHGETLGTKYDELLRNNGDLTFEEVSHEAGVLNSYGRARTPTWVDYNNDGWLDLYIGNMLTPNILYRNKGDGTFADATAESGLGCIKGVRHAWADYDNDGWQDVLVVRPVQLFHNNGDGTFTDMAMEAGLSPWHPGEAQAVAWGDCNNDGAIDLFITGKRIGENVLYYNNGDSTFSKSETPFGPSDEQGMGAAWGDLNNDGWLDLCVVDERSLRIYWNEGTGEFGQGEVIRGVVPGLRGDVALGDYDDDGALDIAVATDSRQYLLKNICTGGHNWLKVVLSGTISNRGGIGAKVWVFLTEGIVFRQHQGGESVLYSSSCAPLHIGLGDAKVVSLRILWPSGVEQQLCNVETNQTILVREPGGIG